LLVAVNDVGGPQIGLDHLRLNVLEPSTFLLTGLSLFTALGFSGITTPVELKSLRLTRAPSMGDSSAPFLA